MKIGLSPSYPSSVPRIRAGPCKSLISLCARGKSAFCAVPESVTFRAVLAHFVLRLAKLEFDVKQ